MNKLRLLISAIFFTAMGLMWMSLKQNTAPAIVVKTEDVQQPNYVARDLIRTVFDGSGRKTQRLSAKTMTFFDYNERAEFESPLLILESEQNKGRWRISSNNGILYNNQRLLLQENVKADNLTLSDGIDRITGEHIRVNLINSTMISEHTVKILGDGIEIIGSGLNADLNEEQIELTKHAKTIYQSYKKQP